ncbi:S1 family peptidase [Phaeobacter inhibens]|uniref:S1 family peptidase n=1 Tax=Phaeobacter inhibens TaxID=221822 RepID=UPI002490D612|nr:S1 family peptidase [Phaeobacter inhibens]
MKIKLKNICCFVLVAFVPTMLQANEELIFEPIATYAASSNAGSEVVPSDKLAGAGAVVVDLAQFPEIHVARSGGGLCTASVLGPKTVLTAAHCVKDGGSLRVAGKRVTCTHSDSYNPKDKFGKTADYALCLSSSEIPSTKYGSILTEADILKRGRYVLLSGFGCTAWNERDGNLRVGHAKIERTPSTSSNDIVVGWDSVYQGDGQGAALCPGDSGGPAFYLSNINDFSNRAIIAVNSRTGITCISNPTLSAKECPKGDVVIAGSSFLSALSTDTAQSFIRSWMKKNDNPKICGISLDDPKCIGL